MKRKLILAGLIGLSLVVLTSFASFAAAETQIVGTIQVSGNGNTWQFDHQGVLLGKEVTSVKAIYWIGTTYYYPVAKNVVINNNKVGLVFETTDLVQDQLVDGTRIEVIADGETYWIAGPGWVYRFH